MAHDMAWADAVAQRADMLLISEPNKGISKRRGWTMDRGGNVALGIVNRRIQIEKVESKGNYLHIVLPKVRMFLTFISPNIT